MRRGEVLGGEGRAVGTAVDLDVELLHLLGERGRFGRVVARPVAAPRSPVTAELDDPGRHQPAVERSSSSPTVPYGLPSPIRRRARVEDPQPVLDQVHRDVRVAEDHQVRPGKPAAQSGHPPGRRAAVVEHRHRRAPPSSVSSVSGAPHAATSGPVVVAEHHPDRGVLDSSSSTSAVHTSPACRSGPPRSRWAATLGGQPFQNRGLWVSERTAIRIEATLPGRGRGSAPRLTADHCRSG